MAPTSRRPHRGSLWLIPLAIFTVAFLVRMAFVMQVKDSPYWRVPLIDAGAYDDAAQEMVTKSWLAPLPTSEARYAPYFQPPLYQTFLALIYLMFGHSVIAAIIIQYLISSLSCVFMYFIGRRLFGMGVGIAAGIAGALTASQIFYEGRLLPPVLITVLNLSIILLAVKQTRSPLAWRWPVIGLLIGLSAVTRPDILLFVPVLLVWMWLGRKSVLPTKPVMWTAIVLAGMLLPVGLVTLRNGVVGKDPVLIAYNGGLNFFVGNYPNIEETLGIRPGPKWDRLVGRPLQEGITRPSEADKFFYRSALGLMWKYKKATAANFVRKLIWVWRGPEIRRNENDYYLTRISSLYRALLWRSGNFGFPFGVIAPLGLLGMAVSFRRRELFLLYGYIVTQVTMLVLFFPCSRYRAPMVPILLIFGAAAVFELINLIRRKQFRDLAPILCLLLALGILPTLCPPTFEGTPTQIEAEDYRLLGSAYYNEAQPDKAMAEFKQGVALAPDDPEINRWLMILYAERGDLSTSERYAKFLIRLVPYSKDAYKTLERIYSAEGRYAEAEKMRKILEAHP